MRSVLICTRPGRRTRLIYRFTAHDIDGLAALVRNRLKRMQYQPRLLEGFIVETGLALSDL
ncbi:hypothetical protein ACFYSC_05670 [Streptosporangium sp. NPDC004379]|uniref:hypothetical protein n=1 Tax=Streptosporangium sp. NPDC004379 TaxID=3366189 RepID=UPI0036C3FF2F